MNISLALGGGGAKGNAHIGVLRRLEQEGFRVKAVAGTSFGGIVAIFYALGYSPAQIEDLFAAVDQKRLYIRDAQDGPALLGLSGVRKWLDETLGARSFADLKLPCAVTAVDIKSGLEVVISDGALKDAVLSTIALPGIFPFHTLNDWDLVDGGVLNPVPVSVARALLPGLPVVAVALTHPLGAPVRTWNVPVPGIVPRSIADRISRMNFAHALDVFMRSIEIENRAVTEYRFQVDQPDIVIRPKVQHIQLLERVDVREVANLGDEAVIEALPVLLGEAAWHRRLKRKWFGGKK